MAVASWLPLLLGAGTSLAGGLMAKGSADAATAAQNKQIALMERSQKYQMARQALTDPLFKELLQRTLMRSRGAPLFGGGGRGRGFAALRAPVGGLPALPPPQLIGEEPQGMAAPAPAQSNEMFRYLLENRGVGGS